MKLTTTFKHIRACSPHTSLLRTLATAMGDISDNAEINLLTILDSNGVQDMLWCLRVTVQDCSHVARRLAVEFAEHALPIFESHYPDDKRPRLAIQAARDFNAGLITVEQLRESRNAAYAAAAYAAYADAAAAAYAYAAAAYAYAAAAAYTYAAAAAYAAADAAADADAADAADAAAYATADARIKQAEIIRAILKS